MKTLAPWFLIALVLLASATAQDLFANPVQPGEDNLLINPLQRGLQIDTCSQATYDIELTNVGPLADAFALTTDNLNDFARFNETVVFLLSGDTTRVQLTFTPPCGLYGPQNINVVGESQSTGIQFFETIQLDIAATDIPLIADGIDRVSIDYGRLAVDIPIKNLGDRETVYELDLDGESWMRPIQQEIKVPPQGSQTIQIETSASNATVFEGEYPVTLIARVKDTGIEYAKTFTFVLHTPTLWDTVLDYWWLVLILVILLILALIGLVRFKQYWEDTREEREARNEQKRIEKEARDEEKRLAKEARQQEKDALNAEKAALAEAKQSEKAALKALKQKDRDKYRHCKLLEFVTRIFLKELRKEYKLIPKPEGKKPYGRWIGYTFMFILLIAACALVWFFKDLILAFDLAVGAGILTALGLLVLLALFIKYRRQKATEQLTDKELIECREEAIRRLKESYILIPWEDYYRIYERKNWGKIVLWTIIVLTLIALAIAAWLYQYPTDYGMYVTGIALALALLMILIALIRRYNRRKNTIIKECGDISANRYEKILTGLKFGLGELWIKLKNRAEGVIVKITSHNHNTVFVEPEGIVYKFFTIDHIGIEDKNIEKVMFRFAVKKSWLKRHGVPEENVTLQRYHNGKWTKVQDCYVLQGDEKVIFYEATHNSLSLFAIVGTPGEEEAVPIAAVPPIAEKKAEPSEGKGWKALLGALLVLFLLALFAVPLYLSPQQEEVIPENDLEEIASDINEITDVVAGIENETDVPGIPTQRWPANTPLRLNLSEYFIDPDDEQLVFTNSEAANIAITYDASVAILTPKADWTGESITVFTATDNENASVDSNPVRLIVTESEIKPEWVVEEYGTYVLLALVFLVLLLIGSTLFKNSEEK